MRVLICVCVFISSLVFGNEYTLSNYFNYSEDEINVLRALDSQYMLSEAELKKWDAVAQKVVEEDKSIHFFEYTRMFTYLYVAQAEAAALSKRIKGEFSGSFDPLCKGVLSLFFTHYPFPLLYEEDPYSHALAECVLAKIKERIYQENAQNKAFKVPQALQASFSEGLEVAKWIPWFANPPEDFWPPAPPRLKSPIWREQIQEIKNAQTPMTEAKKQVIYRWAGLAYPWSADLRTIVNQYLACHNTSFLKTLQVRSLFQIGLYDCVIAYTTCKYHYLMIRPQVYDPSIIYEIPVPKHPSFPSGHSTESALTSTLLSFFFPSDTDYWQQLAVQCATSRIWAGIHYPIDDQGGRICGKKVAERVIDVFKSS